jgi:hypothetical protein
MNSSANFRYNVTLFDIGHYLNKLTFIYPEPTLFGHFYTLSRFTKKYYIDEYLEFVNMHALSSHLKKECSKRFKSELKYVMIFKTLPMVQLFFSYIKFPELLCYSDWHLKKLRN